LTIADLESYAARGMSFERGRQIAVDEYLTNWIALGLDLEKDNVNVYLQSQNKLLQDLAFKASSKTNFSQLKAIYGFTPSTNIAHIQAPLVQVADILLPQIEEFGGPKKVVVPVGIDQDPHIRLTRDIAQKLHEDLGFLTPASTYHRFLTGLTGDKMSSSKPNTAIYLNDHDPFLVSLCPAPPQRACKHEDLWTRHDHRCLQCGTGNLPRYPQIKRNQ
jgi:tryptophanyl-tRNA synthetase